jgi:glycosyltransferase involved in cell wall biosynthesis
MSYGKPVVAYNVGGISDWLDHNETGLLVPRNNSQKLGKSIEKLLINKSLREKFGINARKKAEENYTVANHLNTLENIFNRVLH